MNTSINVRDDQGRTFLWYAVDRFEIDKVAFLLKCGGDPSVEDNQGVIPLQIALQNDDVVAAKLLLDYPSTNSAFKGLQDGPTLDRLLLRQAGSSGDTEILKILLDLGANVNIGNSDGRTPLLQATYRGDLEAIEILLGRPDIDLYAKDRRGFTALHVAARQGRLETVGLLLSNRRLNINCLDSRGNTAFWWSTFLCCDDVSLRLLDDKRLDVNCPGSADGQRLRTAALYYASHKNSRRLVFRMLAATCLTRLDPNVRGEHRWSALGTAAYQGSREVVAYLLRAEGIRINAVNEGEDDPLWLAIQTGKTSVADQFLDEQTRLDINCQNNKDRDTYLLAAARDGNIHLVDRILRFENVDLNAKNKQGESALSVSFHHQRHDIVQRLMCRGAE